MLLANGADIALTDHDGRTVVHWSTKIKSVECLKLVLESAFLFACHSNQKFVLPNPTRSIINKVDGEQLTALHWAAQVDHPEHALILLQNQADPTALDAFGRTPLHYCVTANSLACIQVSFQQHDFQQNKKEYFCTDSYRREWRFSQYCRSHGTDTTELGVW